MRYRWLALAVLLSSGGCAANNAPVVEYDAGGARGGGQMSSRPAQITRGSHTVARGDTLFSIAWRYGWDYRELAAANNIPAPFTIRPGQEIRLDRQATASAPSRSSPPASTPPASTPARPPATAQESRPSTAQPATPSRSTPSGSTGTGDVQWRWPATGELVGRFSAQQAGIRIGGTDGDAVLAAASGIVVYRGNGLTGYGNLLIIKHNDRWLSAYAHNDSMLVREGDTVNAGQRIATMGASGTFRTQLHFEIRRDGQPVDPLTLLPRRS